MQAPQITFHGLAHSPELEADILERIAWLEKYYRGIVSSRVLIEVPHRHHLDGRRFHVTIELTVPFNAARRRLQDFARRQRGAVKTHATP